MGPARTSVRHGASLAPRPGLPADPGYRAAIELVLLALLAFVTAGAGALGGLGGAVLLVPLLVLTGMDPLEAAPLGLLSVAAGSLAAGAVQLAEGTVHHRLGITLEIAASFGAVGGALLAGVTPAGVVVRVLAVSAIVAALAGGLRRGVRNTADATFAGDVAGEWPGTLSGTYHLGGGVVPYQARRPALGAAAMSVTGMVAGLSGVSGGFLKTPAMTEIMHVPSKVAASTTLFTVGITSAAALSVYAGQGRIDARTGAAVVTGALLGGRVGALLQSVLPPPVVRRALSVTLILVGIVLLVRG
ncbi:MAG TPA: sulfite exporter TauE/SafE family protein [Acidimicrobiales bacterium]|nr:sulfite exporter TauE/SafE family protein [Acidimicrobiales bacterium]